MMRRQYDTGSVAVSQGVFVFASVFLALFFLKYDFIANGIFIEDDNTLYWRAKYGDLTDPLPGRLVGSFLYYATAIVLPNISWQMVFYLLSVSTTALIIFLLYRKIFSQTWLLIVAILFAFTSHAVTSTVNFTSANHGVSGLMFAAMGLLLSYHSFATDRSYYKCFMTALCACVFFIMAMLSSPYFYIFFLTGPLWVLVTGKQFYRKRKPVYIAASITLFSGIFILCWLIITNSFYHYDQITGWTNYRFTHLFERVSDYVGYVASIYGENTPRSSILCVASAVGVGLAWLALKANPSAGMDSNRENRSVGIAGLIILLIGGVLVLIPILPSTMSFQPRHVYPSMILTILAVFCAADLLFARWWNRFSNNKLTVVFLLGLLLGYNFSVTDFYKEQHYGALLDYQPMLKAFVEREKQNWPKGAQVIIASDIPSKFTYGLNHWSTGFLRILTEDETLIGLIGNEREFLKHTDPFVEYYRHHHQQYWKTIQVNGQPKSVRLKMFGIVQKAATYAYRFDPVDGTTQRIPWLLVNASDSWRLYRMTEAGVVLHRSGDSSATLADLAKLGIDRNDTFVYGRTLD